MEAIFVFIYYIEGLFSDTVSTSMSGPKLMEFLVGIFTSTKISEDELCKPTIALLNANNFDTKKIVDQSYDDGRTENTRNKIRDQI